MMMVLGLYVFMLRTVPYQELQYQRSWRHAANSRVNRRPSTQFLGPDNDMLTLSGVLMPEITGGRLSLLALEQMAEQGKAWPLIEGSGTIYGMYVIAEKWHFMILQENEYAISKGFLADDEEIFEIVKILKALKVMLIEIAKQNA